MNSSTLATAKNYTLSEEIANAGIHGLGVLLAIVGLVLLVILAVENGSALTVTAVSVYGASLVLLYTSSTLYHTVLTSRAKALFRHLDHISIYLLIAGTYTPFTLVSLHGGWRWSLFGLIWALALAGIAMQGNLIKRRRGLSIAVYVAMGWVGIIAIKPLIDALPTGGLVLMLAGGVAYTLGTVFYAWHRLPYNHAIWHGFVLSGSVLHFLAVLLYVLPGR